MPVQHGFGHLRGSAGNPRSRHAIKTLMVIQAHRSAPAHGHPSVERIPMEALTHHPSLCECGSHLWQEVPIKLELHPPYTAAIRRLYGNYTTCLDLRGLPRYKVNSIIDIYIYTYIMYRYIYIYIYIWSHPQKPTFLMILNVVFCVISRIL